jgi:GTP pyrophosphokinase
MELINKSFKVNDFDEIYLGIGNGKIPTNSVINVIFKDIEVVPAPKVVKIPPKSINADIIVSGIDKVKVNLANCCNPVYGDEIVGYITKGNGISVHRINCHNLEMLEDRTVDVSWNSNINKRYLSCILVYTNDNENHMLDLIQSISMTNISVDGIKVINHGNKNVYEINMFVTGLEQLDKLLIVLNKYGFVEKIERAMK